MRRTRWKSTLRNCLGVVHRELRITLTPLVRPDKWVFLVGCYNSGTELLMRLLGTHPRISSLPQEGQFLTDQFPADYELGLPRMWVLREDLFRLTENDPGPDVVRLQREWIARLDRSKPVFLEKSPPNAARTRWLQCHFENAHFVAIVRNGYAVAEGIRRKAEPRHLQGGWPLDLCARQWNRSNVILLEDSKYLERVMWLRYEDFVRDPAGEVDRVLRFLGLHAASAEMDLERSWAVHEKNDPIRDMNRESISRLSPEEIQIVTHEAEPMLRYFGYLCEPRPSVSTPIEGNSGDRFTG
jgi:hypothetical protein